MDKIGNSTETESRCAVPGTWGEGAWERLLVDMMFLLGVMNIL